MEEDDENEDESMDTDDADDIERYDTSDNFDEKAPNAVDFSDINEMADEPQRVILCYHHLSIFFSNICNILGEGQY